MRAFSTGINCTNLLLLVARFDIFSPTLPTELLLACFLSLKFSDQMIHQFNLLSRYQSKLTTLPDLVVYTGDTGFLQGSGCKCVFIENQNQDRNPNLDQTQLSSTGSRSKTTNNQNMYGIIQARLLEQDFTKCAFGEGLVYFTEFVNGSQVCRGHDRGHVRPMVYMG